MKFKITLSLFILFVFFSNASAQVIGGRPAEADLIKHLVFIQVTKSSPDDPIKDVLSRGGGTIINSRWILTAGHIFNDKHVLVRGNNIVYTSRRVRIIAGSKDLLAGEFRQEIFVNFNGNVILHRQADAALINLRNNRLVTNNKTEPAVFLQPGENLPEGTSCWTSGWGQQEFIQRPQHAKQGKVRVVQDARCNNVVHNNGRRVLQPGWNFCYEPSRYAQPAMSWKGDSGSPITCDVGGRELVAGVVQGGVAFTGNLPRSRGIAVDVRRINGWIGQHTRMGNTNTGWDYLVVD